MERNERLLDAVTNWHAQHVAPLAVRNIFSTLGPRSSGRSKNGITLTVESSRAIAETAVWDSGEAEVSYAALGQSAPPRIQQHNVRSRQEVNALLDDEVARLSRPAQET